MLETAVKYGTGRLFFFCYQSFWLIWEVIQIHGSIFFPKHLLAVLPLQFQHALGMSLMAIEDGAFPECSNLPVIFLRRILKCVEWPKKRHLGRGIFQSASYRIVYSPQRSEAEVPPSKPWRALTAAVPQMRFTGTAENPHARQNCFKRAEGHPELLVFVKCLRTAKKCSTGILKALFHLSTTVTFPTPETCYYAYSYYGPPWLECVQGDKRASLGRKKIYKKNRGDASEAAAGLVGCCAPVAIVCSSVVQPWPACAAAEPAWLCCTRKPPQTPGRCRWRWAWWSDCWTRWRSATRTWRASRCSPRWRRDEGV